MKVAATSKLRSAIDSTPNNALERFVIAWQGRAAGAGTIVAPAALVSGFPRPAQRGR